MGSVGVRERRFRPTDVRGFAVGRSIFNTAARAWFNGTLSDEAAIEDIAERYRRLIVSWREARN